MEAIDGLARQPDLCWGSWLILFGYVWLASRPNPPALIVAATVLGVFLARAPAGALGEILAGEERGLKLPAWSCRYEIERAPLLIISQDAITLNGVEIGDPRTIKDDPSDQLPAVTAALAALGVEERASYEALGSQPSWPGRIILQADRSTPSEVINKVVAAVYRTRWENISFAVDERAK